MANKPRITLLLLGCVIWIMPASMVYSAEDSIQLNVSTTGNDAWTGHLPVVNKEKGDGPFATLERARDEIRAMKKAGTASGKSIQVNIQGGQYFLDKPFALTAEDSGTEKFPIIYTSAPKEKAALSGGKIITGFKPVSDETVLKCLDEKARGNVLQADLKSLGITNYGAADKDGAELFFNDNPMTLARWPNGGFVKIVDTVVKDGHEIHGNKGSQIGQFKYDGDRPSRWIGEKDPWLHGYWFWDWSDQRQKIAAIDAANAVISLATPYHNYGYRKGQWYYAFNMLAELDSPGEWYIDRERGILYFWPPEPADKSKIVLSIIPNIIVMNGASFITFQGLTLENSRMDGIAVTGGKHGQFTGCIIRNTGGWGAKMAGLEHSLTNSEIYRTGGGGVILSGGDRPSLTPGNLSAENNQIHHYGRINRMYTPGISLLGVGNHASHNLIHTAPHMAIYFDGNDHLIELNEIHHVCLESNDAGAIYSGRNWTMRGNMIRYNYLHQITGFEDRGCVGVYLDDMFASATIFGNVFHQVTSAAFIGGGRDNSIENNIFVDCNPALHIDDRALNWAGYHADEWIKEEKEKGTISGIAYNKPPYSTRYPQLVNIINDDPKAPKGNSVIHNICWGGKWDNDIAEKARLLLEFKDNLVKEDPLFVDLKNLDFRLKPESPAYKMGFIEIPFKQIGLMKK